MFTIRIIGTRSRISEQLIAESRDLSDIDHWLILMIIFLTFFIFLEATDYCFHINSGGCYST